MGRQPGLEFEYSNDEHLAPRRQAAAQRQYLVWPWRRRRTTSASRPFDPRCFADEQLFPSSYRSPAHAAKGGKIVWEWHVWDHLIQNRDHTSPIDGDPAAASSGSTSTATAVRFGLHRVGNSSRCLNATRPGHARYGVQRDLVIDHGTTTAEAAGRSGGKAARASCVWGNPAA